MVFQVTLSDNGDRDVSGNQHSLMMEMQAIKIGKEVRIETILGILSIELMY